MIHTVYHISETRKESSDKKLGSTDERKTYQSKEKRTNRHGEKKSDNYSQIESKLI